MLFRGNKEADIRKNLVTRGLIKGIIGLPAHLFYGTGIPACIVVIDKENAHVRTGIFMIDASKGCIKDGNKNRLRSQDIHKIVDVFNKQIQLPRYSRMVPVSEIADSSNVYNLNIPRYIDSSWPKPSPSISSLQQKRRRDRCSVLLAGPELLRQTSCPAQDSIKVEQMRILTINPQQMVEIPFLNAGRGPGGFYEDRLPVLDAVVDRLPDGVSAIIATADLQGRERFQDSSDGVPQLLGEALPGRLATEILPGLGRKQGNVGVFLAGDLYTVPALDRRGGSGDVRAVWEAFGDEFAWVVGVAGNHDTFGADPNVPPRFPRHLHYLDNDRVNIHGCQIAGLGGIIGNPRRPRRRSHDQYTQCLESLLRHHTDVLITHDGPDDPVGGHRGSPVIREAVERLRPSLVVRGHAHWKEPVFEVDEATGRHRHWYAKGVKPLFAVNVMIKRRRRRS